jgi:hypothetical protein
MIRVPSPRVGRANFTTVEDIPIVEEVIAGTFFLFEHPIIILFNLGASHDFMSLAFAQKANLTLLATNAPYSISTPKGRVVADRMVRKIPLELFGQEFSTCLIILEGQGINIILGMNWMKMHMAILDISVRLVHLDSSNFGKISLELPLVTHLQASHNAIVAKSLDEVPVVREYLDVFPNNLQGMPPNRAIEFKIELQPGTAPIYKRPYLMAPNEFAELKTQLQELLDKGYI